MLNIPICVNEFNLPFLPLYSVLVYHGDTNANISPW